MDDRRGAEGIEHLQAAAREMLAAARSFLDVVEDVVEDPERLSAAASSVVDLVRGGVAPATRPSSPLQPWEQAAWGAEGSPVEQPDDVEWDDGPGDGVDPGEDEDLVDRAIDLDALEELDDESCEAPEDAHAVSVAASGSAAAATDHPSEDAPAAPRRRVRRIAVD
ncbi:MAG: hypothetical protein ACK4V6_11545 [Microthrixaceae bacterium]